MACLTIFTSAFCHTRVQNLLKGPEVTVNFCEIATKNIIKFLKSVN